MDAVMIHLIENYFINGKATWITDEYRKKLLDELTKYARFHFTSEENIAFDLKLDGLNGHHERHIELLAELDMHINDLFSRKYTTEEFVNFLLQWFIGHTVYEDTKLFFEQEQ